MKLGVKDKEMTEPFISARMEPLCGWAWIQANIGRAYPEQSMTVSFNGKVLLSLPVEPKAGLIKAAMGMARTTVLRKS